MVHHWIIMNLRCETESFPFPWRNCFLMITKRKRERERKGLQNPFDPNIWFDTLMKMRLSFLSFFSIQRESKKRGNGEVASFSPFFVAFSFSLHRMIMDSADLDLYRLLSEFFDRQYPSRSRTSKKKRKKERESHRSLQPRTMWNKEGNHKL